VILWPPSCRACGDLTKRARASRCERRSDDDERYATWIDMYSGEEFTELTDWCKGLMNDVATNATESDRERYRELFVTSARYEYRFWDAAWRQEAWEV